MSRFVAVCCLALGGCLGQEFGGLADSSTGSDGTATGAQGNVVEFRVDNFALPVVETSYNCFDFVLERDSLAHIVAFEPLIDQAAHVHHYVLTMVDEQNMIDGRDCYSIDGDYVWGWAPGITQFEFPQEAGMLVGDRPGGRTVFRLQIHYNNPLGVFGQVDSSGFAVHLSDELRPNNAGGLIVADIVGIEIPPGMASYEHVARCSGQVTADTLTEPINVFASVLHAHELGSVLWADLERNGEKVLEINRDEPYAFENQGFKPVEATIMPGDEIVNHCIYDSTDRTDVTRGGLGTRDEMCWNTMLYYPKVDDFTLCSSLGDG